jgi:two-component system OmpR family response regulator
MPECSGCEAMSALRRDRRTSEIVNVAFTALNDDTKLRSHLDGHSFAGYCQKGQSLSKLLSLLTSFIL